MSPITPLSIADLITKEFPPQPVWIGPDILPKSCKLLWGGEAKIGKAIQEDEPVLLRDGSWRPIKDLVVGDSLASVDGKDSFVTGVYPQGYRTTYNVIFSDGRSVLADEDHLWYCGHNLRSHTARTTNQVMSAYRRERFFIPRTEVLLSGDVCGNNLPIDPWLLGFLLGDGCFKGSTLSFTSMDEELVDKISSLVPISKPHKNYAYNIIDRGITRKILEELGLWDHRSEDKFIPEIYKNASVKNRIRLLQGLLDSDGTVEKNSSVSYSTSSEKLKNDVVYVVRSLGCLAKVSSRVPTYPDRNGKKNNGLRNYRIGILDKNLSRFFTLSRKIERTKREYEESRLTFKDFILAGQMKTVCISVSHPSKLFITKDFIVTHNSHGIIEMARGLALGEAPFDCPLFTVPRPASVLLVEHELKPYGLQKRLKKAMGDLSEERLRKMEFNAISGEHTINFSSDEGRKLLEKVVKDYRPEILMLDPISKMHNFDENSNTEIGKMYSYLDSLIDQGKGWGMSIIMSHHFGKPPTIKSDREVLDAYNFRGAAKFKDDPDVLITAVRTCFLGTPHVSWRLRTRWVTRHDESPPDIFLNVNENNDLRVKYHGTEAVMGGLPPAGGVPKDTLPLPPVSPPCGISTYD